MGWSSIAIIVVVLATPIDDWLQIPFGRYNLPYVPLLLAVLIIAAPRSPSLRGVMDAFPLRPLGVISYGVYLYHLPVLHVTARYVGIDVQDQWWLFGPISLAVTVAVAAGSYLLIERPITRAVRRLRAKRTASPPIRTARGEEMGRPA